MRDVLTFQRRWNLRHPNDKLAEDGVFGPQVHARIAEEFVASRGMRLRLECKALDARHYQRHDPPTGAVRFVNVPFDDNPLTFAAFTVDRLRRTDGWRGEVACWLEPRDNRFPKDPMPEALYIGVIDAE